MSHNKEMVETERLAALAHDVETSRRRMIEWSVTPSTSRTYYARARAVGRFCAELKERVTEDSFTMFLYALTLAGHSGSTFEGYRAALEFAAHTLADKKVLGWIKSPTLKKVVQGGAYRGGEADWKEPSTRSVDHHKGGRTHPACPVI